MRNSAPVAQLENLRLRRGRVPQALVAQQQPRCRQEARPRHALPLAGQLAGPSCSSSSIEHVDDLILRGPSGGVPRRSGRRSAAYSRAAHVRCGNRRPSQHPADAAPPSAGDARRHVDEHAPVEHDAATNRPMSPAIRRSVVVLPQPDGPNNAVTPAPRTLNAAEVFPSCAAVNGARWLALTRPSGAAAPASRASAPMAMTSDRHA
jgi:hypothetical protein